MWLTSREPFILLPSYLVCVLLRVQGSVVSNLVWFGHTTSSIWMKFGWTCKNITLRSVGGGAASLNTDLQAELTSGGNNTLFISAFSDYHRHSWCPHLCHGNNIHKTSLPLELTCLQMRAQCSFCCCSASYRAELWRLCRQLSNSRNVWEQLFSKSNSV